MQGARDRARVEEEMELELIVMRDLLPPTMHARSKTQRLLVDFDMSAPVQQVWDQDTSCAGSVQVTATTDQPQN